MQANTLAFYKSKKQEYCYSCKRYFYMLSYFDASLFRNSIKFYIVGSFIILVVIDF